MSITSGNRRTDANLGATGHQPPTDDLQVVVDPAASDAQIVAELGRRALTEPNSARVLDDAVSVVSQRLGTDLVCVLELVPGGEGFLLTAGAGWRPGFVGQVVVPLLPDGQAVYLMAQGPSVIVDDLRHERRFRVMPLLAEYGAVSGISALLEGRGLPRGVIAAYTLKKHKFHAEHAQFLESVAAVVAATLDRRATEQELREANERLNLAMQAGSLGTWEWNVRTNQVTWSEQLERIHGLEPGTFGGSFEGYASDIHPDDRERVLETVQHSLEVGSHQVEYRIVRPDGAVRWLSARGMLLRDTRGEPLRMIGVCTDVTEQKTAEEVVRQAEEKYRTLFENAAFGVFQTTEDGRFLTANESLARILGFASAADLIESVNDIGHQIHVNSARRDEFARLLAEQDVVRGFESQARRHDTDEAIWISLSARARRDADGRVLNFEGVVEDITERKRGEQRLAAQYAVTSILSESPNVEDAVPRILQAVCDSLDWAIGEVWIVDRDSRVLRCLDVTSRDGSSHARFLAVSQGMVFEPGTGLPGRVWQTGQPAWIEDVTVDLNFPRAEAALHEGLRCAFAFPIAVEGETIGVMEFFTPQSRQPDSHLMDAIRSLGSQVGQFIERKRTEDELWRTSQNLNDFFDNAAIGLHWVGPDGTILRVNRAELELLGYTEQEYVGHHIAEFHVDGPVIEEILGCLRAGETLTERPARLKAKDGSIKDVLISSNALFENGEFIHTRCFTQDVTARKQAEQERDTLFGQLQSAELRYRNLFNGVTDAILVADNDGRYVDLNSAASELLGYSKEELLDLRVADVTAAGAHWGEKEYERFVSDGDWTGELELLRKDGTVVPVEARASMIALPDGPMYVSVVRDITERREAEQELKKLVIQLDLSRQRVDNLVSNVPGVVWEAWGRPDETDQRIDYVSEYVEELLGYSVEEWLQTPNFWLTIVHPDDKERAAAEAAALFTSEHGGGGRQSEFRWVAKDGRVVWVEAQSSVIRDAEGKPIGTRGVTMDITHRRLAEAQVRESEERFSKAFHASPAGLSIVSADERRFIDVNDSFLQMTGYSRDAVIGRVVDEIGLWLDDSERQRLQDALVQGDGRARNVEIQIRTASGQIRSALESAEVITLGGEPCVLSLTYDITERKQAEQQLKESNALLNSVIEGTTDGVYVKDADGRYVLINNAGARNVGLTPEDLLGKCDADFLDSQTLLAVQEDDQRIIAAGKPETVENTIPTPNGERTYLSVKAPHRDAAGRVVGLIGVSRDITDRKRSAERQELLAEAGAILASSLKFNETLGGVANLLAGRIADICSVDMVEGDTIRRVALAHVDPEIEAAFGRMDPVYHPGPESEHPILRVAHTGKSELHDVIDPDLLASSARDQNHLRLLERLGVRSVIVVPLVAGGRSLGTLTIARSEAGGVYTAEDLEFAEELARRAGLAIDNSFRYEAEQQARRQAEEFAERTTRLQAVTASLSESLTSAEVGQVVIEAAMAIARARSGIIAIIAPDGRSLELIASEGVAPGFLDTWGDFARNPPEGVLDAIVSSTPLFVDSWEDLLAAFPSLARLSVAAGRSFGSVPLRVENTVIGSMVLTFEGPAPGERDRDFVLALGRLCAQALDRSRLYDAAESARREAEKAEERQSFLAQASAILSSSLDYQTTLSSFARLCVPYLGDWCAIDTLGDETLERVAVVHMDPKKVELAYRLNEEYPPNLQERNMRGLLKEGKSIFFPDIPDEMLVAAARDEENLRLTRELSLRSAIAVPLKARGRILGMLTVVMAESGRVYTEANLALAEDLGHRAGLAVDNARLFSESQVIQEELRLANEAKDEFLGLVSHELRTPITTIYGGARLMRSRGDNLDTESRAGVLEDIEYESERLHRIVEDLLVLARVELGQEVITEPLLVQRIAERTIAALIKRKAGRQIDVDIGADLPAVRASSIYLEQILRNLVNNADKYSPADQPISVAARHEGEDVIISVMDRGPGIPPAELDLIFERFYRSSGTAKQAGGAGIGLTVCKRLIEAQEGRIWAEAREGGGLSISFSLPVYSEHSE